VIGGNAVSAGYYGGRAGIVYCGGDFIQADATSDGFYTGGIRCNAGNGLIDANRPFLIESSNCGVIRIGGDLKTSIQYRAGSSLDNGTNGQSVGTALFGSNTYWIEIGGNTYGSISVTAGSGASISSSGGSVYSNLLRIGKNAYGNILITGGSTSGSTGGTIFNNVLYIGGQYARAIQFTGGNGVSGGSLGEILFTFNSRALVGSLSLRTGDGTSGIAGEFVGGSYDVDIDYLLEIRSGTTNTSTGTQIPGLITINGSVSGLVPSVVQITNQRAVSAGGRGSKSVNVIIKGNIYLNGPNSAINLSGGNATTGKSSAPPSLEVEGNIISSIRDTSSSGINIIAGTVTTGGADLSDIAVDTLVVKGNVTVGRITVTGGNQTSTSGAVLTRAGDIANGAIRIAGKLDAYRVTLTGGNLGSSGAIAGQRAGNAGGIWAGSFSIGILQCNGGTVNAAVTGIATKGSGGGFSIINNANGAIMSNTYIQTFLSQDSTNGLATSNAFQNNLAGHIIIDNWNLPGRTTYVVKANDLPCSLLIRSFANKLKIANSAGTELINNLAADSMYFTTGSTWRSISNVAFT
jgi:hypothetical protein